MVCSGGGPDGYIFWGGMIYTLLALGLSFAVGWLVMGEIRANGD
jgi:hypothetical protein